MANTDEEQVKEDFSLKVFDLFEKSPLSPEENAKLLRDLSEALGLDK